MNSAKEIIVAVELGSSTIRAIAARKKPDGTLLVLDVEQEQTNCIRNGVIENHDRTAQVISRLVKKIDEKLKISTSMVNVGLSGQSLHGVENTVTRQFPARTPISAAIIDQMKETNCARQYPGAEILDVATQYYRVAGRHTPDPVGLQSTSIEACYLNVIARSGLADDIQQCVNVAKLQVAEIHVSPICLASLLLPPADRRAGCALVDIGAQTTTVMVYQGNILRHLAVIPIGGDHVTQDIASLNMSREEAEAVKMKYGTACREAQADESQPENMVSLSYGREVKEDKIQDITEARYEEILLNVLHRVKAQPGLDLLSGITFVGGGSLIPNLKAAFECHANFDKQPRVHFAKGIPADIKLAPGQKLPAPELLYTLMALAMHGAAGCSVEASPADVKQTEINFDEPSPGAAATAATGGAAAPAADTNQPETKSKPKGPGVGKRLKKGWKMLCDMLTEPESEEE